MPSDSDLVAPLRQAERANPSRPGRDGEWMPIERYGVLGDGRSVALLSADGAIDWWCQPNMDSVPLFDALVDGADGGCFSIAPEGDYTVERRYLPDTNVLEHIYRIAGGALRTTWSLNSGVAGRLPWSELAVRIEALEGHVPLKVCLDFGRRPGGGMSWREETESGPVIHLDGLMLAFMRGDAFESCRDDDDGIEGRVALSEGSRVVFALVVGSAGPLVLPEMATIDSRIDRTIQAWREWSNGLKDGLAFPEAVGRSALALKLLLYSPTGAIAAAGTVGLPERVGGDKNYDYRYAWVRDAAFTIKAFMRIGAFEETRAAYAWLLATIVRHGEIRTMYTLDGDLTPEERDLDLRGWRDSLPVRTGNRARSQLQLGVYGDVIETAVLLTDAGHVLDLETRRLLADLADRCADVWMFRDSGLWELEDIQHYTASKIGCWAAMDRAITLAHRGQIDASHVQRWERMRERIRVWIEENCWSESRGAYTMYPGTDKLDAAVLLAPRFGFPSPDRLRMTCDAIEQELGRGRLVYRYSGAQLEEGTFLTCAFWLVMARALLGERDAAMTAMAELLDATSHNLGLLAEEMDPATGAMLGNIPQALSHLALIQAADALS